MTKEEALANFIAIKKSIEQFGEVFFDEEDFPLIDTVIDTLEGVIKWQRRKHRKERGKNMSGRIPFNLK